MAKTTRKWLLVFLFPLAVAVSMSIQWGNEYCRLCGKTRDITSLNPLGLMPGWGWVLRTTEKETELSKTAEPLLWPDPSHHQWVRQWGANLFSHPVMGGLGYAHGRFRSQQYYYTMRPQPSFVELAQLDPELARCVVEKRLFPYRDNAEAERQWDLVRDAALGGTPHPEEIEEWRAMCGLPPWGKFLVRLGLSREGAPAARRWTVTLSNAGTEPIIVDRELVLGMSINMVSGEGAVQGALEVVQVLSKPTEAEMTGRFVEVGPGQSLSRTIDLGAGFRVFREHEGPRKWREEIVRLPGGAAPEGVVVTYDLSRNCPMGGLFYAYQGLEQGIRTSGLGFYPVPAEARLEF